MKDISELLANVLEASGEKNIKTAAGIGAGIGAAIGLKNNEIVKSAVIGASIGAALAWIIGELEDKNDPAIDDAASSERDTNSISGES